MTMDAAPFDLIRRVYDMTVASDICLPELHSTHNVASADIVIRQMPVAQTAITDQHDARRYLQGSPDHLWMDIPAVLRMEIKQGRLIDYFRYPQADDDEVRLFLLGSGLGAVLTQRGHVVIHGNAIVPQTGHGAILCIGESGAGKSTTAVAMMQRGLKILADDICPIDRDGFVLPGMSRAKLWDDTARQLGIDTRMLSRIRNADAKFNLPLEDAYCAERQAVRAFYWLVPDDVIDVSIQRIHGAEKLRALRNNVYRPEFLPLLGLEADYLKRLAKIASGTPLFKVLRPTDGFDIDSVLDAILSTSAGLPD